MTNRRAKRRSRFPGPRVLVLLLLFIAGGAIVNVAVAWGLVLTGQLMQTKLTGIAGRDGVGTKWVETWVGRGSVCYVFGKYTPLNAEVVHPNAFAPDLPDWIAVEDLQSGVRAEVAYGWPMLALRWTGLYATNNGRISSVQWGIVLQFLEPMKAGAFRFPYALPLMPVWPGFAINTIFYAAILWLLFYAPGKVRRLVRVRKGQCPTCGFIIAPGTCANGLCTECGSTLPERLVWPA